MAHGNQQRGPGVRPLGRRRFLQITAAGLGAVALMRTTDGRVAHAQFDELYRLARAEGQLNLYGGGPTAPFEASGRQFTAAFPGITVNVTGGFSNVLAPEIDRQIAAGSVECDVTVLQTLQDFERWKQQNALLPFRPDGFDQIPDGFKDPDATSVGLRVGAVAFAYNPDRLPEDVVPATAQDFLDPQLGGLCITCYPQDDDLTLYRYTTIVDKYGWDWMDAFMVNRPQFIRGHLGVVREIMADRAGVSFDSTLSSTLGAQANGGNITLVIPEADGMPIWAQGAGIFRAAPHPNAAKLYVSWLLSRDEQSHLPPGNWPVRQDVPPPAGFRPILEYNVLNGYRDFVIDEPRLEDLRRRFEGYVGPVRGEPVI
ncbi:MAG TPA: ABC transporter substrate-binding protein [Chloroflexota bacterium]|nr:ABC transporter substrate-binding protein [Chloroflexota bacterium]